MSNTTHAPTHAPEALGANPVILWDAGDAASLRRFLERNPRFLTYLASRTPPIAGTSLEAMAISGATHAGYEELFRVLSSMASDTHDEGKSPFIEGDEEEV